MAVSIVGTPLAINDGTSYTAETGSDRVVCVVVGVEEFNAVTFAPTYGGVAFVQGAFIEGADRSYMYIGYILEANIPAGSNAFALVPSAAVDETDGVIYTLSGVDQSTVGTGTTLDSDPATASPVLNLTGVADGAAVAIYEHEATSPITVDGTWTTDSLNAGSGHKVYVANKTTTAGATTFSPTTGVSVQGVLGSYVFDPVSASGPSITNVNTTNVVQVGDVYNVTGTSFLATAGSQTFGGQSITATTWADTSLANPEFVRGDLNYANHDWIVADNLAVASAAVSVQLAIEAGYQVVTLSNPIITLVGGYRTSLCYGSVPDCVTGDQLRAPTTTTQGNALTINVDGTFSITGAGNTEQTFSFEVWDANAATNDKWSASTAAVVNGVIVGGGGILRNVLRSPLKNILRNVLK
jgi:hypothetical protein